MAIYAAFTIWFFLILFTGIGVYRLWAKLIKPAWVNWALLPGTIVSEMCFIFGTLITGGEIRRAKIMPDSGKDSGEGGSEPTTESQPKLKYVGPIIAALIAVVGCGAAILLVHAILGKPVIDQFTSTELLPKPALLSQEIPTESEALWNQVKQQVDLLQRMCGTLFDLDWFDWRVPLFVYLAACLSVRLAPVRRDMRATLAAVVVIAIVIALVGLASNRFKRLMEDIWPLVTYIWANLLFLLVVTLIISGLVALMKVLFGKKKAT